MREQLEWAYHDRDHLAQALPVVRAPAWPHMGNARRFYGEPGAKRQGRSRGRAAKRRSYE